MNAAQRNYVLNGSSFASRLGVRGIQAANSGSNAFRQWVETDLRQMLPGTDSWQHFDNSTDLSPQGMALVDDVYLLFFSGARSARHGALVLDGIVNTYESEFFGATNKDLSEINYNRWASALRLRDFASGVVIYGHSFGGVCAESLAEKLARDYPSIQVRVETYGCPRTCIAGRYRAVENLRSARNLHAEDVVSHVPYNASEARLAAAVTPARVMRAFNAAGHTVGARVFSADGRYEEVQNNRMQASDITLTIAAWVTYAQHLTSRAHELATYVSLMDAYAARSADGQSPSDQVSVPQNPVQTSGTPVVGDVVDGPGMTAEEKREYAAQQEREAMDAYLTGQPNGPAVAVVEQGVAGVRYRGVVSVRASDRKTAKRLARTLNRVRKLLGPCTTDQRADILNSLELDIQGPL